MDQIPRAVKGTVQDMLDKKDELNVQETIVDQFGKNFIKVLMHISLISFTYEYCYQPFLIILQSI